MLQLYVPFAGGFGTAREIVDTPAFVQHATRARADVLLARKRERAELVALSDALYTTAMGTARDEIVGQLQLPLESGDISILHWSLVSCPS